MHVCPYMEAYTYIHAVLSISIHPCIHTCLSTSFTYIQIHVCVSTYMHTHVYLGMHAYIHVHTYIYSYTHKYIIMLVAYIYTHKWILNSIISKQEGFQLSSNIHIYYAFGNHITSLLSVTTYVFFIWQTYFVSCIYANNF